MSLTAKQAIALMARTCGHSADNLLVMNGGFHCAACRDEAEAELAAKRTGDSAEPPAQEET